MWVSVRNEPRESEREIENGSHLVARRTGEPPRNRAEAKTRGRRGTGASSATDSKRYRRSTKTAPNSSVAVTRRVGTGVPRLRQPPLGMTKEKHRGRREERNLRFR